MLHGVGDREGARFAGLQFQIPRHHADVSLVVGGLRRDRDILHFNVFVVGNRVLLLQGQLRRLALVVLDGDEVGLRDGGAVAHVLGVAEVLLFFDKVFEAFDGIVRSCSCNEIFNPQRPDTFFEKV